MWAKPISMDFGFPKGEEQGRFMCGRHGSRYILDWPEERDKFSSNVHVLLSFAAIKIWSELCCQSTISGTSSLTFCKISSLKPLEAFEKIIKHQTALKFEFGSMHLIGQKIVAILHMAIFLQQRFVQSYAANLLGGIFLIYLPSLSLGWSIWVS